ncbi:peptidase M61 [Elizabethkingia bruuniana]|uniref:Peptidase M61 n=1 Tax=Elizabethkingia bruuniana TaxID=1756149 RepID=A0A7T7UVZ2_9FLAO|nr:peptidase M61 [Elizabethkingia bruuniana]KGO09081.1 peptidase M61 [Elizabethkingia miricola]AQX83697.1 peptidase M61 [Elizabethkingia bruuniana]KUY22189.1 peptidase M61 [Elizabethkingia bruuniana]OPB62400.1 peptidase M61 [Elizabethkingia bruuniana]QDZ63550.1 peptidase M61 [Elizabethkingia bruuniana]
MNKITTLIGALAVTMVSAQSIKTNIDLVNIKDDKVAVTMEFPKMKSSDVKFHFPKTVPGTYSVDDYGRFIEGIKFYDNKGRELPYTKVDDNTYTLKNARDLTKVTYLVNDSFDEETDKSKHKPVFSPTGTDIEQDKVYLVNTHGFVGYIDKMQDVPYRLVIQKPADFYGTTALVDQDKSDNTDTYVLANYAKLTDSPLMYTKPNYTTFNAGGMDLVLGVYSPTGKYKAADFKDNLEKMVVAQKKFLGDMNTNKKYAIMLYLTGGEGPKVRGYGALEHHESTSVVLPEAMSKEEIDGAITDVVSHEFFHTVNPLKTHSEEIHYFDYADPKMSQHLWMYEGGTEYFANLFQIQEGLIDKNDFLARIGQKISGSKRYKDTLPFTVMSKNVLQDEYKDQYANVYEKGALLAMCLDIELRELSKGEMGYRDMIRKLSQRFGENKPFKDDKLIDELVIVTGYPQIKDFYNKYIAGSEPTPYEKYLNKVGIETVKTEKPFFWLTKNPNRTTTYNQKDNTFTFTPNAEISTFGKNIGFKTSDEFVSVDGKTIDPAKMSDIINYMSSIKEGADVTITVLRKNGDKKEKIDLKGKAIIDKLVSEKLQYKANPTSAEQKLQNQWLTGKK